jgi:hypothetical protein
MDRIGTENMDAELFFRLSFLMIRLCWVIVIPWHAWLHEWLFEPLRANWPLLLIGVGGVVAAIKTLNTIERQTKATEKAADAAKVSADAALLNAQVMINTERALIEVGLAAPSTYIDRETGEEMMISRTGTQPDSNYFRYGIKITNHGRTVARIASYRVWHDCFTGNFARDRFDTFTEERKHMLLAADKSEIVGNFDIANMFNDDWPSMQAGTKTGMLRIDVRYEDVIRAQVAAHETSAVFYYSAKDEEPERLAQYNVYT